jgi:hypothetical protein
VRKADGHFDVVDSCISEYRRSGWNSAEDRACLVFDAVLHAGHTVISYPLSGVSISFVFGVLYTGFFGGQGFSPP